MSPLVYHNRGVFVALLAEGVDRNSFSQEHSSRTTPSPSSRRAWIEIHLWRPRWPPTCVALLAEGVDRNLCNVNGDASSYASPSSRRAWIEIHRCVL